MQETYTALGGTFDHFHAGHAHFIAEAASLGQPLIIGVTSTLLTTHKKHFNSLQSYEERAQSVASFCVSKNIPYTIVELTDTFGPTISNPAISKLAFTSDTRRGADQINEERNRHKLPALQLHEVSLKYAVDGYPISSERIRGGEINRSGTLYISVFSKTYYLSEKTRTLLQKPIGTLVTKPSNENKLRYLVGDSTTERFQKENWSYQCAVVDYMKKRMPAFPRCLDRSQFLSVLCNPPHSISLELLSGLTSALKIGEKAILVIGEEDLAAVALVLLLPLGTVLYYGQPDEGLIECEITETLKDSVYSLLCL